MTDDNPAWLLRKKKEEEYMATFLEDFLLVRGPGGRLDWTL